MEMDEMIPVDQFFEEYVNRLQQSAFSEDLNPYAVGGLHRRPSNIPVDVVAQGGSSPTPMLGPFGTTSTSIPNHSSVPFEPIAHGHGNRSNEMMGHEPMKYSGVMTTAADFGANDQMTRVPEHDPYISTESTTPFQDSVFGGAVQTPPYSTGSPFVKEPPLEYGQMAMDTVDNSNGNAVWKGRQKTARQQQLNKLAQQRYRERKKAKTVGLQQTVDTLTSELHRLDVIKEQKQELEQKNSTLERQLIEKEAELQSLKTELEQFKGLARNNSANSNLGIRENRSTTTVGVDSRPAKLFHKKVKDLKQYLKTHNLDPSLLTNPLDESIPKKVVDDIYQLVGDVCMTCMQLTRHDGPDLWDLISASLDSKQRESHDRVMWRGIVRSLKLGKEQVSSALRLRELHMTKLEKIYIQRQTLNLQAIQHLLPSDQGGQAPTTSLGCFNIASFVQRLRHTAKLNSVLDSLKDNLSKEQKVNSELEYMTFYRVMSPLQGAWFTVSAYPHQCDCLEFLNAVNDLYGRRSSESTRIVSED